MTSVAEYSARTWHGMIDFRDAGHFVCQSGALSVDSGDIGKLTVVRTEGI